MTNQPRRLSLPQHKNRSPRPAIDRAPLTRCELVEYVRDLLDVEIAHTSRAQGSASPLDYLVHAFFEPANVPTSGPTPTRDCIVWANRAGGKTFYGAIATLLDLVHKPGIEVKILAGSLEQAHHMHNHLRRFFERPRFHELLDGKITDRRIVLTNGSRLDLLAQSHTSVRGNRPQKLRCDEVELFDPEVWDAAQFLPMSRHCAGQYVHASIEAFSTWHRPFGLMTRLLQSALAEPGATPARKLFRWNVVDVLQNCPAPRPCDSCALQPECQSLAKNGGGHIPIDDAINHKRRASIEAWQSEMLCTRPNRGDCVFTNFNPDIHTGLFEPPQGPAVMWIGGMDFGYRAPTVILWACVDADGFLWIVDERIERERLLADHIRALSDAPWPRPAWIGVDPSGSGTNSHSGVSDIEAIRRAGFTVRHRSSEIREGLALIRARISPAAGPARIRIHSRCQGLIRAMREYHYPLDNPESEKPVKDGSDHAIDALRYMLIHLDRPYTTSVGNIFASHISPRRSQ